MRRSSGWIAAAWLLLPGCAQDDSELIVECPRLEEKAWFEGPSRLEWTVHQADDPRVLDVVPTHTVDARWRIEEAWLTAVTEEGPPLVVASFPIEDHVAGEPDPEEVCGVRSVPEGPWPERRFFRVDFSSDTVRPPGLFAAGTEVETGGFASPEEIQGLGIHVGADGGAMPLSFIARPTAADEWSQIIVRLTWRP